MSKTLEKKINSLTARVAVVGLGYVGLPLAVNFAKKGFTVFGLDLDADRVSKIRSKTSYILDVSSAEVKSVVERGKFIASTRFDVLSTVDCIIICVPTPLKSKYTPDISYIVSAVRTIRKHLKKDTLVVLESTTYPGTTSELIKPQLERGGWKAEKDFYLAFSPERIDPGNKDYDVTRITKVVGGLSARSGALTKLLYEKIIKKVHLVCSTEAAEMTKLLENTFRLVNIGWVNEVAMMCHKMGINVWEVIEAASTKPFGFMPFYPGLGVGGHCIPEDPLYLYWKAKHHGLSSKFIKLSADINSSMPKYAIERIREILKARRKTLARSRLLIIGASYKKDVKDLRKSPSLRLIELLQRSRCRLDYHDPIIPYLKIDSINLQSVPLTAKMLPRYDCVVIATDHTKVDYGLIFRKSRAVFDIKNVHRGPKDPKIIKL